MRDHLFNMTLTRFSAPLLLAAVLAGCSDNTANVGGTPDPGTGPGAGSPTLTISLSPNTISSAANGTVTATLRDGAGNGISGAVILFSTNAVFGVLSPTAALTDASGVATSILSPAINAPSGADTVSAAVDSAPSTVTVPVTGLTASTGYAVGGAVAPTVGSVTITSSASTLTADGFSSTAIIATVRDAGGAVIPGATVNFVSSAGTLSAAAANTNASGKAQVTLTAPTTKGSAAVNASSGGSSASINIAFVPGPPAHVVVDLAPSTTNSGGSVTISATVSDQFNNVLGAGEAVGFSSSTGGAGSSSGGLFSGATSAVAFTNVIGMASTTYTAGTCAATSCTDILSVTAGGVATVINLTVNSSNISVGSLALATGNTGSVTADGATATAIRATVKNSAGTGVPGVTVNFTTTAGSLSSTAAPVTAATTAITDNNGIAQLYLIAPIIPGTARVTANASGFSASANVSYVPGAPAVIGLNAKPSTVHPGGSLAFTVAVLDAQGNPVAAGETINFTTVAATTETTGGAFSATSRTTDASGTVTVTYTAGSCAVASCIATLKATATNGVSNSTTVTVSSGAVVVGNLSVVATNPSIKVKDGGAPTSTLIKATVTDTGTPPAPIEGLSVTFQTNAGSLTTATATTDASGVAQVTLDSSKYLGTATVSASASGFYATTTVSFVAGNANSVQLQAFPSVLAADSSGDMYATVLDVNNNPVSGQTVTFSFALPPSTAVVATGTAVTDASGVAHITYTSSNTAGVYECTATLTNGISATANVTVTGGTAVTANSLMLSATPATIKTDDSNSAAVTVKALSATNAVIPNVVVTLAADTGVLSAQTVTTDANGEATFTYSSGSETKYNRTGSITASAGTTTKTLLVPITGSTLSVSTPVTSVSTGTPAVLTVTAKDAGGDPASGQTVSFTMASGSGEFRPAISKDINGKYTCTDLPVASTYSVLTDTNGLVNVCFTATAPGAASVTADWLDGSGGVSTISATQSFTAAASGTAFELKTPDKSPFAVTLGTNQAVTVYVPATILTANVATVRFSTPLGTWLSSGAKTTTVPFTVAGNYTETFVAGTYAGNANVQVDALDASGAIISSAQTVLSLSASAANAATISLQANVTSIAPSAGGLLSTASLTATVKDGSANPVGNAPVLFELVNPTGTGETVSPVAVMTAAIATSDVEVGQALSTFIAGTLPTTQASQIRATVIGSSPVVSSTITVTVGGTAASIAVGTSTKISSVYSDTAYQMPVTVMVSDANGNAVAGQEVSLSLWATVYRKGVRGLEKCGIIYDADFANEDANENLILDPSEDVDGPGGHAAGTPFVGSTDGILWPPSSAAGSVPQTVTTGADGSATFNLTYLKSYSGWLKIRLRARTQVQGTEATYLYSDWLPISAGDAVDPCPLPYESPFN